MATASGGRQRRSTSPVENAITTKTASKRKAEATAPNVTEKVTEHINNATEDPEERKTFMSMLLDWP